MLDSTTEFWVAISQILTAIGTFGALIFVGLQSWHSGEQVKIMKNEFVTSKRPWIYRDSGSDSSQNYLLSEDKKYKEKFVRVPFINQGRFHSSSVTYYHMFITLDGFKELYNKQLTDEDLNNITKEELDTLKSKVKKLKYIVVGPRVIVPGTRFGKKFYLTKNKMEHYRQQNPDDSKIIQEYENGEKIYLVIFIEYRHEMSKENCEYGGILKLEKSTAFRNDDWLKEWVS